MPSRLTIVILVDHGYVSGGQSKVAIESALGLKSAGARVIFFCATGPLDPRLGAAGVEAISLDQPDILSNPSRAKAAIQGTWNAPAVTALETLLAGLPRDNTLIHVHGWAKALSPAIALPLRAAKLPAVYTMHEYFLHCPNGGFYDYQKHAVCNLKPMSPACWATHCDSRNYPFKLWRNARLFIAQHVARLADVFADFVLISDLQEQLLKPCLPKGARVSRVVNPIEAEPLGHKNAPASGDFIFVGRLSAEKGAFLFAEAAEKAGVTPVFIGDGPVADELAQRFPRATLLGWKSPPQVREAMRAARALVFPSLWYEGQPLTVQESMALGTPVLVSDICAAREQIADGESGLLFKGGDAESLAGALRRAADDALIARLSPAAYDAYWRDPPTLQRHIAETLQVYERALARRNA